jgi:hypothetical protein
MFGFFFFLYFSFSRFIPIIQIRHILIKDQEISIFSNSSHLEWRAGLSDTILKGNHPGTIPAGFGLIWFSGFRGEDLNVIFYQNIQYKTINTQSKN